MIISNETSIVINLLPWPNEAKWRENTTTTELQPSQHRLMTAVKITFEGHYWARVREVFFTPARVSHIEGSSLTEEG